MSKFSLPRSNHLHIQADALDVNLPEKLIKTHGEFDVAVCNPPYTKPSWRPEFEQILEDAGLEKVSPAFKDTRAEILFLAQNLRLTRDGGHLSLIVPDGIVSGERCRKLREKLLETYHLQSVIELPRGAFSNTEAKAHIIILKKGEPVDKCVKLMAMQSSGQLSHPLFLSREEGGERLDYGFHAWKKNRSQKELTLKELGVEVARGTVCSKDVKNSQSYVFHTSDFSLANPFSKLTFRHSLSTKDSGMICAIKGDVLVARVDRKLEEKVCYIEGGGAPISDCVFRIRSGNAKVAQKIYEYLVSYEGKSMLKSCSRGVGARYLTRADILNIRIKI